MKKQKSNLKQIRDKKQKKKNQTAISQINVYIQSTFNNTIITITDNGGNALSWASAGAGGFKGAKKSTPFAAQIAMNNALDKIDTRSVVNAKVFVKGVGSGRDGATRALAQRGIKVSQIKDVTPMPHNGTRAKKPRRV
ncbi:MAG: 30S ribosomal protein S11 [Candidatus Berkelbacteria bacterium Licking1014_7]|uniref:Small ribosomal subunit protein uS11 n=1 Tax=Candidatus Berkelbacteria bacterium Licking1014_7 TaxID=2017147 RepID=A0A554LI65_9BACT|nr:MAG: 30S ribosomal protein S11 [Candidatus Berkelbacteria bacterium Licking1014_7]